MSRNILILLLILVATWVSGCHTTHKKPAGIFRVKWDPGTGRGMVSQRLSGKDRYYLCLQCRYKGYAGGVWVGNLSASGFLWVPAKPINHFRRLNIFCAQDESIFDLDEKQEYDCGWSQNFGKGHDGTVLKYVEGQVIRDGSKGRGVVLRSMNQAGAYRVIRFLYWPAGADWFIISTHIVNIGKRAIHFAFWTGEDPWIGTYGTSKGDVGWYSGGIVNRETAIKGKEFRFGGLVDRGNAMEGQAPTRFSGVADFIQPDPGLPSPDKVFFANSFAHKNSDIDPSRPLDSHSLTAFNLGWTDVHLNPGQEVRFCYALGRADSSGELPHPPPVPAEAWDFDLALHLAYGTRPHGKKAVSLAIPVRFYAENIRMLIGKQLEVDATYSFRNLADSNINMTMFYPFPVDVDHPYPTETDVWGVKWRRTGKGLLWSVAMAPKARMDVRVRYVQAYRKNAVRYILATTGYWGAPLEDARYEVRVPAGFRDVRLSYPAYSTNKGRFRIYSFTKSGFLPDRDLVVTWSGPKF